MPNLILSFDMNTAGPKSGEARATFEETLKAREWRDHWLSGGVRRKLPNTTFVATKADAEGKQDVTDAEAAAKRIEPAFELTRYALGRFALFDGRGPVITSPPGTGASRATGVIAKIKSGG